MAFDRRRPTTRPGALSGSWTEGGVEGTGLAGPGVAGAAMGRRLSRRSGERGRQRGGGLIALPASLCYALEALVYLAARSPEAVVPSHVIARARGVPERYLLKALTPLAAAGLLRAHKGPGGGFRLAVPPSQITLLDVARLVEPGLLEAPAQPGGELGPFLQRVAADAGEAVRATLARRTLADCLAAERTAGSEGS